MNINNKLLKYGQCMLVMVALAWQCQGRADDAEIYSASKPAVSPNILFLLDTSGSMQEKVAADANGVEKTRMQVMQEVLGEVLKAAPANLNIGLMRYGGEAVDDANGVSFPISPIDAEALPVLTQAIAPDQDNLPDPLTGTPVRQFLSDVANSWSATGNTPIVDALYEAAHYFRGEPVSAGALVADQVRAAHPSTYKGTFSYNACSTYSSPFPCNNTAGLCSGQVVAGSCAQTWLDVGCEQYAMLPNQCCGWGYTDVDESGNGTNYQCTGGFTCDQPDYGNCLVKSPQIQAEVCQQTICLSAVEGTANYTSPIVSDCQPNYLVLMSDGKPEYQAGTGVYPLARSAIETLVGASCADAPFGYQSGTCGRELVEFLATVDQNPTLAGKQLIKTFTIGFALDEVNATAYMQSLASMGGMAALDRDGLRNGFRRILAEASGMPTVAPSLAYAANQPHAALLAANAAPLPAKQDDPLLTAWSLWSTFLHDPELAAALSQWLGRGWTGMPSLAVTGGGFFSADNVQGLTDAFSSILDKVQVSSSSFASPSYKVDPNSLLAHADEVYIPMFAQSSTAAWAGNLKKFKLKAGVIVGKDDAPAVDARGQFIEGAWDFWGSVASGADVASGGAASLLDPATRTLYTDQGIAGGGLVALDVNVDKALLGDVTMSDGQREAIIQYARGYTATGEARKQMGDIMNSKPVLVQDAMGKNYVLTGTNEGYLHAFDASTGVEQWAFMPSGLLKNLKILLQNEAVTSHVYGLDGALTVWHDDKNHDGLIKVADGDKTYLYFGLRRGGSAYYALDITVMNSPKLVWQLDKATTGFNALGESWSKPVLAQMRVANPENAATSILKNVLVFGGGFDPALEEADPALRVADGSGYDVYIVDAQSGSLLWSLRRDVSSAALNLKNSIPGDIRVLDMDRNGALDRLYFADTGGKVWRVDMDVDVKDGDPSSLYDYRKARLSGFADLAGAGADRRMFYYEPDVAVTDVQGQTLLTLAIGSGYRSHPLKSAAEDRFYVLVDRQPFADPDTSLFPIQENGNLISLDELDSSRSLLSDTTLTGWYYDLPNAGEKVLAPALTFMNKVIFTTFSAAETSGTDVCKVSSSTGRAYVLDIFNGLAVADLDPDNADSKDRSVVVGVNEIPDMPQVVFQKPTAKDGGACTASDCQQAVEVRVGKMQRPLLDASNTDNNSTNMAERLDLGNRLPRAFWLDQDVGAD